jgi:hypothetical protein
MCVYVLCAGAAITSLGLALATRVSQPGWAVGGTVSVYVVWLLVKGGIPGVRIGHSGRLVPARPLLQQSVFRGLDARRGHHVTQQSPLPADRRGDLVDDRLFDRRSESDAGSSRGQLSRGRPAGVLRNRLPGASVAGRERFASGFEGSCVAAQPQLGRGTLDWLAGRRGQLARNSCRNHAAFHAMVDKSTGPLRDLHK